MTQIKSAGVIGAGVIGSGWIARLLLNGIDVFVFDPSTDAPKNVQKVIQNAERAYKNLLKSSLPEKGSLTFSSSVSDVAKSSELIISLISLSSKDLMEKKLVNESVGLSILMFHVFIFIESTNRISPYSFSFSG